MREVKAKVPQPPNLKRAGQEHAANVVLPVTLMHKSPPVIIAPLAHLRDHAASRTRTGRERVISSFHRRQNTCICNSSVASGAWRFIPREMSDHSTSRTAA